MKKLLLVAALAAGTIGASAQVSLAGSKFIDNWSFTLKGGAVTPLKNHSFIKSARGVIGAEFRKQVTPCLGLGLEGEWTVNTSAWSGYKSNNAFDHQYVGVFGALNLMNAFAGYTGAPRFFEMELVAGTGWLHAYYPHTQGGDSNTWGTKAGLNFNFNLGKAKAWTIALKPAFLWAMNTNGDFGSMGMDATYNANACVFQLQAGVTYHFGNSNGTNYFTIVRPYDQAEVDALNAQINGLRRELAARTAGNVALKAQLSDIQSQLDACNRRPTAVEKVVKDLNNIRYVFFNLSSATVQANQQPNIAMVADALKANNSATCSVKGYASKDGSLAFNQKLAQRRADSVKKELVKRYGIASDRVQTEGQGIGELFSENSWNRVAVCTVNE